MYSLQNTSIHQYIDNPDLKVIDSLFSLKHPNILTAEGLNFDGQKLIIILPLTERKLSDLEYEPFLTSVTRTKIDNKIAEAKNYLLSKGLVNYNYDVYLNDYEPYLLLKDVKDRISNEVIYPESYHESHREVLKVLLHTLDSNRSIELLFLAVDLYNRIGLEIVLESELKLTANACIQIAEELLDYQVSKLESNKLKVIYLLKGNLNHSKYYQLCCNIDELRYVFDTIIMNKDSKTYLSDEFEKSLLPDRVVSSKEMSINEFLNT